MKFINFALSNSLALTNQEKNKSLTTLIAQLDLGSTINSKKVLKVAETDQMADKPDGWWPMGMVAD